MRVFSVCICFCAPLQTENFAPQTKSVVFAFSRMPNIYRLNKTASHQSEF
jgi:hypothetical protein